MTPKTATLGLLLLFVSMVMAQAPAARSTKTTPHVCHLVSADSPESNPFQFVPKNADFTRLNRFPKVSYVVNENGNVSGVHDPQLDRFCKGGCGSSKKHSCT